MSADGSMMNFNVGVLGHVDSGKTALAKALSTISSTACFDKNPQSKERGITLDLGFSSLCIDLPEHLKIKSDTVTDMSDGDAAQNSAQSEHLQFTLVDCPGHASLIRTIIGGAQIIDLMMLVIDVTKGMQTQTAECLVIGQITCGRMIVVLNKLDLLPTESRQAMIEKMTKKIQKTLQNTKFANCPVVAVAAKPGGPESTDTQLLGIDTLIDMMKKASFRPNRNLSGPFIYAVDHCFSIRGQGTVMTGTILSGSVAVNDNVEIAAMKLVKKVKSMQMFKRNVNKAVQGDRVALCVTQFEPKQLERGLVSSPGALPTIDAAIISAEKIAYFRSPITTKTKFHVTMGHMTVMAHVMFFGCHGDVSSGGSDDFDFTRDYHYQDELLGSEGLKASADIRQFALLQFERPVTCASDCLVIGSKLDTDIYANSCRLAFHGRMLKPIAGIDYVSKVLPSLRVYKNKHKEAIVERKTDDQTVVCRGLFKKESKIDSFVGLKVKLSTGEDGVIEGGFGQSGKFKVRITAGLSQLASEALAEKGKKRKGKENTQNAMEETAITIKVLLDFKRYIYDSTNKIIQN